MVQTNTTALISLILFTEQGIQHLLAVLQFGHNLDDLTSHLIHSNMEAMTLELGTPRNPFTLDYGKKASLTTNVWMKTVWHF